MRVLFTGTPVPFEITPFLGGLIGVVTALLLLTVAILAALKVRNERRAQRPSDLPLKKTTGPSSEGLYDVDEQNPDVVPINKGVTTITSHQTKIFTFTRFQIQGSDYHLTGSTSETHLASQNTPDGLSSSSLIIQQSRHAQNPPGYSHNDYNNYPTLPVSGINAFFSS